MYAIKDQNAREALTTAEDSLRGLSPQTWKISDRASALQYAAEKVRESVSAGSLAYSELRTARSALQDLEGNLRSNATYQKHADRMAHADELLANGSITARGLASSRGVLTAVDTATQEVARAYQSLDEQIGLYSIGARVVESAAASPVGRYFRQIAAAVALFAGLPQIAYNQEVAPADPAGITQQSAKEEESLDQMLDEISQPSPVPAIPTVLPSLRLTLVPSAGADPSPEVDPSAPVLDDRSIYAAADDASSYSSGHSGKKWSITPFAQLSMDKFTVNGSSYLDFDDEVPPADRNNVEGQDHQGTDSTPDQTPNIPLGGSIEDTVAGYGIKLARDIDDAWSVYGSISLSSLSGSIRTPGLGTEEFNNTPADHPYESTSLSGFNDSNYTTANYDLDVFRVMVGGEWQKPVTDRLSVGLSAGVGLGIAQGNTVDYTSQVTEQDGAYFLQSTATGKSSDGINGSGVVGEIAANISYQLAQDISIGLSVGTGLGEISVDMPGAIDTHVKQSIRGPGVNVFNEEDGDGIAKGSGSISQGPFGKLFLSWKFW